MLRETRSAFFFALSIKFQAKHESLSRLRFHKFEAQLARVFRFPFEHRLYQSLSHALGVGSERNSNSQGAVNLSDFSDENLKDDPINRIIRAKQNHRTNLFLRLPKAIYSPISLFETIRIPRKVVVQDCVKTTLKIDAFAQAIRRYQDSLFAFAQ